MANEELVMGEPDANPTKTIFIVRHGETSLNAEHKMRGWDDPGLNETGVKDAQALARCLKGIRLDEVFSSDLKRAVDTMQTIVSAQGKRPPVTVTELLRTIDAGVWTGKPIAQVEPLYAKLQDRWKTKPDEPIMHGESWTEFQKRQLKIWKKIVVSKGSNILVVSHLRCSVWALGYTLVGMIPLAGDNLDLLDRITQESGCVTVLTYSPAEGLKIEKVNHTPRGERDA